MNFEEKVKFIRRQPQFKVIPISEVKAIAFVAQETTITTSNHYIIGLADSNSLVLGQDDVRKIVRAYPDLQAKFDSLKA